MKYTKLRAIVEGHAYNMDGRLALALSEITGRPETECLNVLRKGYKERVAEMSGRGKEERALRATCDTVVRFLERADEYAVSDLIGFLSTHDPLCVWAVLVGQNMSTAAKQFASN